MSHWPRKISTFSGEIPGYYKLKSARKEENYEPKIFFFIDVKREYYLKTEVSAWCPWLCFEHAWWKNLGLCRNQESAD